MTLELLPEIKKNISDRIVNLFKEQGAKAAFTKLYTILPIPIRLLVKEEKFVSFCIQNQDKFFGNKVKTKKATKKSAVKKPAKKAAAKKTTTKKVAVKKATPKKVTKKTAVKKAAKKTVTKKAVAKKAAKSKK